MRRKKVIIAIIIIVVVCVLLVFILISRNPKRVFSRIFGFELPESAQFVEYHYQSSGDYLGAKIRIDQRDMEVLRENLFDFFKEEIPNEVKYWGNTYSWWDLDENTIILRFMDTVEGKKILGIGPKSSPIWAFLARDANGEYYLYIHK